MNEFLEGEISASVWFVFAGVMVFALVGFWMIYRPSKQVIESPESDLSVGTGEGQGSTNGGRFDDGPRMIAEEDSEAEDSEEEELSDQGGFLDSFSNPSDYFYDDEGEADSSDSFDDEEENDLANHDEGQDTKPVDSELSYEQVGTVALIFCFFASFLQITTLFSNAQRKPLNASSDLSDRSSSPSSQREN